ncbi:MAG: hypothetical protein OXB99_08920 [Acidimicrobiaceae bacterium]|nr:hypothetical protein [Acidimicrobiaceae bacterium]
MSLELKPAEVFPPGVYLRDELAERGWTISEFAVIVGQPSQVVSAMFEAMTPDTRDVAPVLSDALGASTAPWLSLEIADRIHRPQAGAAPQVLLLDGQRSRCGGNNADRSMD